MKHNRLNLDGSNRFALYLATVGKIHPIEEEKEGGSI
jgi:hypothetical protein